MRISVKVKPGAKEDKVKIVSRDSYIVFVKAKAKDGEANYAVREALADYFNVPRSRVLIVSGKRSRSKVFDII